MSSAAATAGSTDAAAGPTAAARRIGRGPRYVDTPADGCTAAAGRAAADETARPFAGPLEPPRTGPRYRAPGPPLTGFSAAFAGGDASAARCGTCSAASREDNCSRISLFARSGSTSSHLASTATAETAAAVAGPRAAGVSSLARASAEPRDPATNASPLSRTGASPTGAATTIRPLATLGCARSAGSAAGAAAKSSLAPRSTLVRSSPSARAAPAERPLAVNAASAPSAGSRGVASNPEILRRGAKSASPLTDTAASPPADTEDAAGDASACEGGASPRPPPASRAAPDTDRRPNIVCDSAPRPPSSAGSTASRGVPAEPAGDHAASAGSPAAPAGAASPPPAARGIRADSVTVTPMGGATASPPSSASGSLPARAAPRALSAAATDRCRPDRHVCPAAVKSIVDPTLASSASM